MGPFQLTMLPKVLQELIFPLSDTAPVKTISIINDLPPEIRAIIFAYCDMRWRPGLHPRQEPRKGWWRSQSSWNEMPAVVVALRPQSVPYFQALDMFYKQNCYKVHSWNFHSFRGGTMLPSAISTIRQVDIALQSYYAPRKPYSKLHAFPRDDPAIPQRLHFPGLNVNVQTLSLHIGNFTGSMSNTDRLIDRFYVKEFPKFLTCFTGLKNLEVEVYSFCRTDYREHPEYCELTGLEALSENTTIMHKYGELVGASTTLSFTEVHYYGVVNMETWSWKAAEGNSMDWSKVDVKNIDFDALWRQQLACCKWVE